MAGDNRWRYRILDNKFEPINDIVTSFNEIFNQHNGIPDTKIGNIITGHNVCRKEKGSHFWLPFPEVLDTTYQLVLPWRLVTWKIR